MAWGGVPFDLIPLNWSKLPETKTIFQILSICFGPYSADRTSQLNTADIFDQVQNIAYSLYIQSFDEEDGLRGQYTREDQEITEAHKRRLKSAVLTNQAVACCLNITDHSSSYEVNQLRQKMIGLLDQAIKLAPNNQVALLNRHLLSWQTGQIRDD